MKTGSLRLMLMAFRYRFTSGTPGYETTSGSDTTVRLKKDEAGSRSGPCRTPAAAATPCPGRRAPIRTGASAPGQGFDPAARIGHETGHAQAGDIAERNAGLRGTGGDDPDGLDSVRPCRAQGADPPPPVRRMQYSVDR